MPFKKAQREAVPLMISLAGASGSGKTYSAMKLAAGIAGANGKVGFIDTEAGRGSMYADDPDIISIMPGGEYYIQSLTEPFSPKKYQTNIRDAIKEGMDVLIVDSISQEWEGFGGCQDIAENNKLRGMPNWAMAKMEHKKLMNMLTQCPMHIIFCLRAREKSKPIKNPDTGKTEIVECGMQAIQEKNFMFEMTLSMLLDTNAPGKPIITKCPKPLRRLFTGDEAIITENIGVKLREWSEGGASVDMKLRNLMRECREYAMKGSVALNDYLMSVTNGDKALLKTLTTKDFQEEMRTLSAEADNLMAEDSEDEEPTKLFNDK